MSSVFISTIVGFEFQEGLFTNASEFAKAKGIFSATVVIEDFGDKFVLAYDELYRYRTSVEASPSLNSLLFRYKVPSYDGLSFEIVHQGKLFGKDFQLRVIVRNRKQAELDLENDFGCYFKDQYNYKYFLSKPNAEFVQAWKNYQIESSDQLFSTSPEYRLTTYSKLVEAYDSLELSGNSILDTFKVKVIDNLQYNLTGNEDGSWDVIPAFEDDLEKFNNGLNEVVENAKGYSNNVVFNDRKGKKKYNLYFTQSAEKAWSEFVEIKKMPHEERSKKLKSSNFIEMFPPKLILGNIYSDRVAGFTLDSPAVVARDNKSSESWSEGFDEVSNLIKSTSGAVFNIPLAPAPELYSSIRAKILELKEIEEKRISDAKAATVAKRTEPVVGEETVYVEELKDEFNVTELETLAARIEKANTVEISDVELEIAKEKLAQSKANNLHIVSWGDDIDGSSKNIPARSLELSLKNVLQEQRSNQTVTVNINEPNFIESKEQADLSEKWYMKDVNISEAETCNHFKNGIKLRSYQVEGYAWLQKIAEDAAVLEQCKSRGALLADDMGLGKTIQVIRLIAQFKSRASKEKPILIVGPVSLLKTSWEEDGFRKFFNADFLASTKIIHLSEMRDKLSNKTVIQEILSFGQKLQDNPDISFKDVQFSEEVSYFLEKFKEAIGSSIIMCSYETMRSRIFELATIEFSLIVLDEAQKIKNISTGQSRAAKALKGEMKVAMTGTPIENSIMDLWSICDFVVPGHVGDVRKFKDDFHKKISLAAPGTDERKRLAKELEAKLKPIWLRRTKKEILTNGELLPAIHYDSQNGPNGDLINRHIVQMSNEQFEVFETQVGYFNDCGRNQKLAAIRNMLEACYAPWWAKGLQADYANIDTLFKVTPKLKVTFDILNEIARKQEKVLIFVNIKELQQELAWLIQQWYFHQYQKSVDCEFFNGDLSLDERSEMLKRFQKADGFKALIISPRSGGAGLNLVEANHVIHYTREWNPAVERQATDRAHRLGQTKTVHVYYPTSSLTSKGIVSAEEHLANILRDKREVIDDFTVSQGDLGNVEAHFNAFTFVTNDTQLTCEGVKTLGPYKFEKLVGLFFKSKGYAIEHVGMAGDKGCDVVCFGKDENLLVQAKFTELNLPQGTKAIGEIRGAHSFYKDKYKKDFKLVAFTNASFQPNAQDLAVRGEPVSLYTGNELNEFIENNKIFLSQLK